jgi:8-oxo-dGTP diphosphatase
MEENLEFIYKKEFWFISAFLNSSKVNGIQTSKEIENLLKAKFNSLTVEDIYRRELANDLLELVKNISMTCKWIPFLENFPYRDENSDQKYDTLGYFQFDIEYFKDNSEKKKLIKPMLIQQVPLILLDSLKEYIKKPETRGLYLDTESPVYVFVTSNGTKPNDISWTQDNIETHKRIIGDWTEIYSGQWEDYSETLYNKRIKNNLSNRLTELHFIRRNSGFIYMAEENYEKFFESYMIEFVIEPTPRMRAVLFALRTINESLDLLFVKTQSQAFQDLKVIEDKIKNLRFLRGLIQTNLSSIYNELDYNRRQHYTSVLKHLLKEFEINDVVSRINDKFNIIYDAIQVLYQKKNEENQQRTEKGLNLLNLLFGAGILADLAGLLMIAFSLQEGKFEATILNGLIAFIIISILLLTIGYYVYIRINMKGFQKGKTIDAVIEIGEEDIILIKRKYPPYKDYYALPGGFIENNETAKEALIREVKEETNLDVQIIKKIGVYDEPGRDPRGRIVSTAFKCKIDGDLSDMKSGFDSKQVEIVSKESLKDIDLAFDHKKILEDAQVL